MNTMRTGRTAAWLTLAIAGSLFTGLAQTSQADAPAKQAVQASFGMAPVVKIDHAMFQELTTLSDGTAQTKTYLDSLPTQSASKPVPTGAAKPAPVVSVG